MDWVTELQRAIDYMEEHLTDELDYEKIASVAYCSSFHFQRVFGILSGYTLGEYIRNRRLSLAGSELLQTDIRVMDLALKYGYESPDSFTKAFARFHGITPIEARRHGAALKSFSRLSLQVLLKGGHDMRYRLEEKPAMVFTGYKRRFKGIPGERSQQEGDFFCSTRTNQYILHGLAWDDETTYCIVDNIEDDGYDFVIAVLLEEKVRLRAAKGDYGTLEPEERERFQEIAVPAATYAVFETRRSQYPTQEHLELRCQVVMEWLPSSGYELAQAPEIEVIHWAHDKDQRYIELWLPVCRIK